MPGIEKVLTEVQSKLKQFLNKATFQKATFEAHKGGGGGGVEKSGGKNGALFFL